MVKIYLDEPIKIQDIAVGHTYHGLKHMADHYKAILQNAPPGSIDDPARQHIQRLLETYQQHTELYEKFGQHLIDAQKRSGAI